MKLPSWFLEHINTDTFGYDPELLCIYLNPKIWGSPSWLLKNGEKMQAEHKEKILRNKVLATGIIFQWKSWKPLC